MIYIFTGNGKGKTTAAIGTGIRAAGAQMKVFMIQFLKPGDSSEIKILEKIDNFEVKAFGDRGFKLPKSYLDKHPEYKKYGVKPLDEKDYRIAEEALNLARKLSKNKEVDLLILDEINLALHFGLIKIDEFIKFLDEFGKKIDIILTGRYCPQEVLEKADLVTDMKEVKHYYQKGIPAKKGIDY